MAYPVRTVQALSVNFHHRETCQKTQQKADSRNEKRLEMKKRPIPLSAEQELWLSEQFGFPVSPNPCVKLYGFGPDGAKCKGCVLLFAHWTARKFYKCKLRNFTHGPGSDHRANWPACKRFIAAATPPTPAHTHTSTQGA